MNSHVPIGCKNYWYSFNLDSLAFHPVNVLVHSLNVQFKELSPLESLESNLLRCPITPGYLSEFPANRDILLQDPRTSIRITTSSSSRAFSCFTSWCKNVLYCKRVQFRITLCIQFLCLFSLRHGTVLSLVVSDVCSLLGSGPARWLRVAEILPHVSARPAVPECSLGRLRKWCGAVFSTADFLLSLVINKYLLREVL